MNSLSSFRNGEPPLASAGLLRRVPPKMERFGASHVSPDALVRGVARGGSTMKYMNKAPAIPIVNTPSIFHAHIPNMFKHSEHIAHRREEDGKIQGLCQHLEGVARRTGDFASKIDLREQGYICLT